MPLSHGGRQGGDVGGDQMICLLVCFVYLILSSERVKRAIVLTLSVQSLGRGLISSMQRGFRLRLRESHGLGIHFRFYVQTCMSLWDRKDFEACTW